MLYVYFSLFAVSAALIAAFGNYKKELFKQLDTKGHPFRFIYPASARVYDLLRKIFPSFAAANYTSLKQLYVKGSVEQEAYLFQVKRIAAGIGVFLLACGLGMLLCITNSGEAVVNLSRNSYGNGTASYQLDVSYGESSQSMDIEIEEAHYTREEILQIFDDSIDAVKETVLAENESWENVNTPLNLISEYGDIDISWETEDTDILNYNGEIVAEIEDSDSVLINLYATFSMDGTEEIFSIPAQITAKSISEKEALLSKILSSISEENSVYDENVSLPESIDGESISFSKSARDTPVYFLVLSFAASALVVYGYGKRIKKKLEARKSQMMTDFPEIVSKLGLLYEAGLSIFRSWERIVKDYEKRLNPEPRYAYMEMKLTLEEIKSGVGESEAYSRFGKRCALHPYIKLGNMLEQNLSKGGKGLKTLLGKEAEEAFSERTRLARKKGEEASTKLMGPMFLMLIIVIVIVAVPALMSINF